MDNIYADIAQRTDGNIYIGVVGPVRTGKSTMIKRMMEQLVIPNIGDPYRMERARDELPQSGSGKTIMTSEPKFIPEEAVQISPDGTAQFRVRFIDSVGYMVDGAVGAEENGSPRMVTTPWYDHEIPMTEAAELGTKKVMQEHCSLGLVVTTDGTVTDIPRSDYIAAENRAISDMKATGKPFLVIINSAQPHGSAAAAVHEQIHQQHGVQPMIMDCQAMGLEDIQQMLQNILYSFPLEQVHVHLPRWMDALEMENPVKSSLYQALLQQAQNVCVLADAAEALSKLRELPQVKELAIRDIDLSTGSISCSIALPDALFYETLSEKTGIAIQNDAQLFSLLTELASVKREYDKIADALSSVNATGYGLVMPTADQMVLQTPEILRKGSTYGVKLRASAPSIHMMRVDIDTEINPMVGDEQQSRELISYLAGENPDKLWESHIFGKSVYALIQEGLAAKLVRMPEDVRAKFRGSLQRVINEGANGLICLIL
jgi:stage IV sporulation protein A